MPPPPEPVAEYLPAGHRSGSHADSVWPYLEESRRLVAAEAEDAAQAGQRLARSSWVRRFVEYLRGDSEVS